LALLCVAAGVLGLLFSGCPQPEDGGGLELPQYTITFESHGGSDVQPVRANKGTAINKPVDPTRAGYTFLGWFIAETGGTLYSWPHTLTVNVTMHAQWQDNSSPPPTRYTITFESHGGTEVEAITANEGTTVSQPVDPIQAGYTFTGWFNAETGGVLYSWPHILTATVTMHAQWQSNSQPPTTRYTITFESHGGTEVEAITANEGTTVSQPVDPIQGGYTFVGWFNAETGGVLYSWPHTLTANVTMHAQWRPAVSVNISVWVNEDGNILSSGNDITISKSASGVNAAAFSAEVSGVYSGVQWYLNEDPISGSQGTARSITINAADYENGSCYLGVSVSKDGVPYSTLIRFTVID
jgi:uncharacterized repeat protein (TIGR02543 family)